MKKVLLSALIITFISTFVITLPVKADNIYYVNDNGLKFTRFQYDVVVDMVGFDRMKKMDQKQYNSMEISKMTDENTNSSSYVEPSSNPNNGISLLATSSHSTASKRITLVRTCTTYCNVIVTADWYAQPATRSYDVIGVRLANTAFYDNVRSAYLYTNSSSVSPSANVTKSNGQASIIKLPSGTIKFLSYTAHVKKGGSVFASYQHAIKSVSLTTAKAVQITGASTNGVFFWDQKYGIIYDQMSGVHLS